MSTRGWALTLGVGLGTAWLVVYEGPSAGKPLNGVLGPALLVGLALCLVWFFFDPHIKRHGRRVLGIPSPTASVEDDPDDPWGKNLTLEGLSGAGVVWCYVRDSKNREFHGSQNLLYGDSPIATRVTLSFPRAFPNATPGSGGRYRMRWLVEFHSQRGSLQEVATGRFKLRRRPPVSSAPDRAPETGAQES